MSKNRDPKLSTNRETIINNLIKDILNIKRQIDYEGLNEKPIIKLGRRLEQRSNEKLSKQILEHIITRYSIDNKVLPTKDQLITLMINYLGNIQKSPDSYNLNNEPIKSSRLKRLYKPIGKGVNGIIYSFKPDELNTKKSRKKLAFKDQKVGTPYNIDKHIVSAILLAYYDFQPKYYNKYFMEVGTYDNKSDERSFKIVKTSCIEPQKLIEDKMKWYILYNFANIGDQVHNFMERTINKDFVKIDIKSFNSESKYSNMVPYLNYLDFYQESFRKKKNDIIYELNKILLIKEEFILDLILFRTERGGFNNIKKENIADHFDFLSSSYNVLILTYKDDFKDIYNKYIDFLKNNHCEYNIPLSYIFLYFLKINVFTKLKYKDYVYMFKSKAKNIQEFAQKIRKGEIKIEKKKEIKIKITKEINEKKEVNKEIKEETKIENKEKEIGEYIGKIFNKEIEINKIELKNNLKNEIEIKEEKNKENIKTDYEKADLENNDDGANLNIYKKNKNKVEKDTIMSSNKNKIIEPIDLEVINFDNINENEKYSEEHLNLNNNKNKISRKNNFIETTDRNRNSRNIENNININKKSKISCWFCCGADSVDVI